MVDGQVVIVKLYGGETAQRRVVADRGDVIAICAEEEYISAKREGREPKGLGFPRECVMEADKV